MFLRLTRHCLFGVAFLTSYSSSTVRSQEAEDYELRIIANSTTFSQAIAINADLEVLGNREVTEGDIGALKSYFRSGEEDFEIAPPEGFTNIEPQALSDSGVVIGYISRPAGNPGGGLRGFCWDSKSKTVTILEPLPTDTSSHAQDISADGKRITGYSTGSEPARIRPCVWQWNEESKKYVPEALPTLVANNPFVQASQVIISPNGNRIAASITEKQISEFIFDSSLYAWERSKDGKWEQKKLSDEQPKLKDMNDEGTMVGSTSGETKPRACKIDRDGNFEIIELLEGDESNVAYGINNAGTIVGLSDDPHGPEGAPRAFIWAGGQVKPLRLLRASEGESAALSINQDGAIAGYMYKENAESAAVVSFVRVKKNR